MGFSAVGDGRVKDLTGHAEQPAIMLGHGMEAGHEDHEAAGPELQVALKAPAGEERAELGVEGGCGEVFYAGRFFGDLLVNAPWTIVQIGLVRLFIELVINSSKNGQQA